MKHDKYAVYILIIVAIVGVVALASFVSNSNTLTGQSSKILESSKVLESSKDPYVKTEYLDIAGRAVDVGDIVTVRDGNGKLLTATVTENGLVYNGILFTCTEWQSNICKTTAKFS
jgi:hypothetical protein